MNASLFLMLLVAVELVTAMRCPPYCGQRRGIRELIESPDKEPKRQKNPRSVINDQPVMPYSGMTCLYGREDGSPVLDCCPPDDYFRQDISFDKEPINAIPQDGRLSMIKDSRLFVIEDEFGNIRPLMIQDELGYCQ